MMLLIKNIDVYAPEHLGVKDVLICGEQIEWISESIEISHSHCQVLDGSGKRLTPGFMDQHVHITGGGGEGSFATRVPELQLSEMIQGGITTVVGLLGTDGITRSIENLVAKAKALREEGVSAYAMTGAYGYPSITLTGSITNDIVYINEILGLKLAISDHRAPNVTIDELIRIGSDARVAGMISGKPGAVILHMGDDIRGLEPVFEALEKTSIPAKIFRPTHVNRSEKLMEEALKYLSMGGYADYTCGMGNRPAPSRCAAEAARRGLPVEHITFSSDGHGSWSTYDAAGNLTAIGYSTIQCLLEEFQRMVREEAFLAEDALPFLTSNVAKALNLYPKKGCVKEQADADLLIFNEEWNLHTVIARGQRMMENGKLLKAGTYEKLKL